MPPWYLENNIDLNLGHKRFSAILAETRLTQKYFFVFLIYISVFITFMGTRTPVQLINELWSHDLNDHITVQGKQLKVMKYFWQALNVLDIIVNFTADPSTR